MLTLFERTTITLLVLHLAAGVVHAEDNSNAPRSHAIATVGARILVLCGISTRSAPGCPTPSLSTTFARMPNSRATSSPTKANIPAAQATAILNFE